MLILGVQVWTLYSKRPALVGVK